MSYSFRIRFNMPDDISIEIDVPKVNLGTYMGCTITLYANEEDTPIKQARKLVLRGDGYATEEEAWNAGLYCKDALSLTFARLRIGADFGGRVPKSGLFRSGLEWLKQKTGAQFLNDVHGLMAFENDPPKLFATVDFNHVLGRNGERFTKAMEVALNHDRNLSEKERLAFEFFATSYFQKSIDARFIMLMIAIEILIELDSRSPECLEHVEDLVKRTRESSTLSMGDKDSLIGSLQFLRKESIGQAGRKLAEKLGDCKYAGKKPSDFFTECYALRSRLLHGNEPYPTRDEIADKCSSLQEFVGDLLASPLTPLQE
jgi:hypothetical protein